MGLTKYAYGSSGSGEEGEYQKNNVSQIVTVALWALSIALGTFSIWYSYFSHSASQLVLGLILLVLAFIGAVIGGVWTLTSFDHSFENIGIH